MSTEAQDKANIKHPSYDSMMELWQLDETLWGGTRAMRQAGRQYLLPHPNEGDKRYEHRLQRSTLLNYYKKAVRHACTQAFADPITLKEASPALEEWSANVDQRGSSLDDFARRLFEESIRKGVSHFFVDSPIMPQGVTLADQRKQRLYPYFVQVPSSNVFFWRTGVINGIESLQEVRFYESLSAPSGTFGVSSSLRIRRLLPGRWEVYREDDKNNWVIESNGTMGLPAIPWVSLYTRPLGPAFVAEPAFQDLADLNVEHWQSSSDQRNILTHARFPMLAVSGVSDSNQVAEVEIGPNRVLSNSDANGRWYYVEHSGAAINSGAQDLKDLEARMSILALEPMMDSRPGDVTATERSIDASEARSELQAWSLSLKYALEAGLKLVADYDNALSSTAVVIAMKPSITRRDADELTVLQSLRSSRDLTRETLWGELSRRGVLSEDFDAEKEAAVLDTEAPSLDVLPADDSEDTDEGDDGESTETEPVE